MIAIVSLMFCAIVQSRYSIKNLSDVAKDSLENSLEMLKYIMENIVFLQIGLILVSSQSLQWNGISMFLARVASVYILSTLLSSVSSIKIGKKYKIIIIVAGLRGGISYALAMNYYDSREQRAVLTATIVSIIAPIIICGFPLPFLMTKLGIQSKGNDLPVDETV
ncbi:MAG: sodium:proton antiporter activity, partial [Paramarteilia canceri]